MLADAHAAAGDEEEAAKARAEVQGEAGRGDEWAMMGGDEGDGGEGQ